MTARYDIYRGDIVAHIDGKWRKCRLIEGWCTIARWDEPNQHLGVCMVKDLGSDDPGLKGLSWHPALWIGSEVTDRETELRLPYVRYGRVASVGPFSGPDIIDCLMPTLEMKLSWDYDDANYEQKTGFPISPSSPQT